MKMKIKTKLCIDESDLAHINFMAYFPALPRKGDMIDVAEILKNILDVDKDLISNERYDMFISTGWCIDSVKWTSDEDGIYPIIYINEFSFEEE